MKKRIWTNVFLAIGFLLSLFLAISDLLTGAGISACNSACTAVHNSSFGKVAGIPVGFFGAIFFGLLIWSHWRRKERLAALGIGLVAGAETYLTLIQFTHLDALCYWCLGFYGVVLLCLITQLSKKHLLSTAVTMTMAFLITHFVFFPPGADLKASLVQTGGGPQIEIFASPSCEHCEEAIQNLEALCSGTNMDLVLRPVGLSDDDRKSSTDWVCNTIFERHNATSRRLAERIVWKNEREARELNGGSLAVPIIVVKTDGGKPQTFKGWDPNVKAAVENMFGFIGSMSPLTGLTSQAASSVFGGGTLGTENGCGNSQTICSE